MAETALLAVYDGRNCVGHLLHRGKSGVEAFDADDNSLGLFPTQAEAAAIELLTQQQELKR
jgi:hypothetical protein